MAALAQSIALNPATSRKHWAHLLGKDPRQAFGVDHQTAWSDERVEQRVSRDDLLPICSLAFTTRSRGSYKLLKLNIFYALAMNLTDH